MGYGHVLLNPTVYLKKILFYFFGFFCEWFKKKISGFILSIIGLHLFGFHLLRIKKNFFIITCGHNFGYNKLMSIPRTYWRVLFKTIIKLLNEQLLLIV